MKKLSAILISQFKASLLKNKIPEKYHTHYLKWLRYYLDFCHKYGFDESSPQSLPDFIKKLKEKNQTAEQQKQAGSAVHIYYNLIRPESDDPVKQAARGVTKTSVVKETSDSFRASPSEAKLPPDIVKTKTQSNRAAEKAAHESWQKALSDLSDELRVRHYSPKTLKSYSTWVRKIQNFSQIKPHLGSGHGNRL